MIDETAAASANLSGLQALSEDQIISFTLHVRWVLPMDGYVFWLSTGNTLPVRGSLHTTMEKRQDEDESPSVNRVVLTTGDLIQEFNVIAPDQLWVGELAGQRFAFSHSGPRFRTAGLYHYNGTALLPSFGNMLVPVGEQYPKTTLVSSNSLPLWLSLKTYSPIWLVPPNPKITLFPSYAVPNNLAPPYGVVHITPSSTRSLQPTPLLGPTAPMGRAAMGTVSGTTPDTTHWQLTSDKVRITLYGTTNQQAMDFIDLVNSFSYDQDLMGIMSATPARDEKRTQPELGILAMKKSIEYEISYFQTRVDAVARQLIDTAFLSSITFNPLVIRS